MSNSRIYIDMDVLKSEKKLREMPFSVPDGYFDGLQCRIMAKAGSTACGHRSERGRNLPHRLLQTVTAAAMLSAVVAGSLSISSTSRERIRQEEQMLNDAFFYTELMPNDMDILYEESNYGYVADSDLSEEDIIDYLIYSGIPVEELNESDYE